MIRIMEMLITTTSPLPKYTTVPTEFISELMTLIIIILLETGFTM